MGDNGGEAVLRQQGLQRRRVGGIQILGPAPPGISGKKLKGVRAQLQRLPPHSGKALGGREVTADVQHKEPPVSNGCCIMRSNRHNRLFILIITIPRTAENVRDKCNKNAAENIRRRYVT